MTAPGLVSSPAYRPGSLETSRACDVDARGPGGFEGFG
jgi:hypothetical protein